MIFRWIARRMRWLSRFPGAPQIFDAALLAWTVLFDRKRLKAMESFEQRVRNDGIQLRVHRLGGVGFVIDEKEIGHLHGNGLLDLHVGRSQRTQLVAARQALPHHVFPRSGWISFWLQSDADLDSAWTLFRIATREASRRLAVLET